MQIKESAASSGVLLARSDAATIFGAILMGGFDLTEERVGDCEIRSISIDESSVVIKYFDPKGFSSFSLCFHGVVGVAFEANHLQNVSEALHIFQVGQEDPVPNHPMEGLRRLSAVAPYRCIAYIEAITGGEAVIAFNEYKLVD